MKKRKNKMNADKSLKFISYFKGSASSEKAKIEVEGNVFKGIEIFRTGVFRGKLFDAAYVQSMADNFGLLRDKDVLRNVPVRADHPDWFGMKPVMTNIGGYIKDVYVKENGTITVMVPTINDKGENTRVEKTISDVRLVVDMEITEPEFAAKIERGTYRDRSIEFGMFDDNDGNVYTPVLAGVAFVDIPQVNKLNQLFAHYEKEDIDVLALDKATLETLNQDETPEVPADETPNADMPATDAAPVADGDGKSADEAKEEGKEGDAVEDGEGKAKEEETPKEEKKEMSKSVELMEAEKNELIALRAYKQTQELNGKLSQVEAFVTQGFSTPAMAEFEKQFVTAIFAKEGEEGFLAAEAMFELFKQMKSSTPKIWAKKDDITAVDDSTEIQKQLDKETKLGKGQQPSKEEVQEHLKKTGTIK